MALDNQNINILYYAAQKNIELKKTLTLGRYENLVRPDHPVFKTSLLKDKAIEVLKFADNIIQLFGADVLDFCDVSDYEGANVIHDLNLPLPKALVNRYDTVIDFGTLEHVFDVRQSYFNAMTMIKPGGNFIFATPANNLMGHGFYQFGPEFYTSIFSKSNGFELVKLVVVDQYSYKYWYDIDLTHKPDSLAHRFEPPNRMNSYYVMGIAKKTKEELLFQVPPQQLAYKKMWVDKLRKEWTNQKFISFLKNFKLKIEDSTFMDAYRIIKFLYNLNNLPKYYRKESILDKI